MNFLQNATKREEYPININAVEGFQFGKAVYSAQTDVQIALKIFDIDTDVQRELNSERVGGIVKYIINGLQNDQRSFYFPPFIFSARKHGVFSKSDLKYKMGANHKMIVLDGQHRLRALEQAIRYLKNNKNKEDLYNKLLVHPLTIQIYYDLSVNQEQQLFSDINSKAKKVGANLIKMYSKEDKTSKLVRDIVDSHPTIPISQFELRKDQTRTKLMTGLNVYKTIAMLDSGRHLSNHQIYNFNDEKYHELRDYMIHFLNLLIKYAPFNAEDRSQSIYLNQGVILGIANIAYELPINDWENELFIKIVKNYDWSQNNLDLKKYNIPYNSEKRRYRLTPPSRVQKSTYTILKEKMKGRY